MGSGVFVNVKLFAPRLKCMHHIFSSEKENVLMSECDVKWKKKRLGIAGWLTCSPTFSRYEQVFLLSTYGDKIEVVEFRVEL